MRDKLLFEFEKIVDRIAALDEEAFNVRREAPWKMAAHFAVVRIVAVRSLREPQNAQAATGALVGPKPGCK